MVQAELLSPAAANKSSVRTREAWEGSERVEQSGTWIGPGKGVGLATPPYPNTLRRRDPPAQINADLHERY